LLFLRRSFRTTNARKPIKGSKDTDCRLGFIKENKQKIASCGWGPGPNEVIQKP